MSQIINFCFNGQFYYLKETITLCELITYFNYTDSLFILEYNKLICNKKKWKKVFIKNNDRIEVVTIVGGG